MPEKLTMALSAASALLFVPYAAWVLFAGAAGAAGACEWSWSCA